ncbi:MAG: transporter [Pseudomonadota bacterium]
MFRHSVPQKRNIPIAIAAAAAMQAFAFGAAADSGMPIGNSFDLMYENGAFKNKPRADGHAPIGVMGDHIHKKGELMLSYRYMYMDMESSKIGLTDVSPKRIVTTVPNRFFGRPMQPPTLRVVPTNMDTDMHMFGGMYGITDRLTFMAMLPYIDKDMNHITFRGGMGTRRLGTFSTHSDGVGDFSFGGLYGLYDKKRAEGKESLVGGLMFSAPTGSTTEKGRILTPMGGTPIVRLPYAMQLGSGTWDIVPSVTYKNRMRNLSFGAQYRGKYRLEYENDEGYRLGNKTEVTGWASYEWANWISNSVRVSYMHLGDIDGIDSRIVGPVQTANPDFYGGDRADILFGMNLVGQEGLLCGQRVAAEVGVPFYQDLNGPQLQTDYTFMIGWQKKLGKC